MTPEMVQWAVYAGLVVGGWLLRHYGVQLPALPAITPPSGTIPVPALPSTITLSKFPVLSGLLSHLGPDAEKWALGLVQSELQKLSAQNPPVNPPAPEKK